MIRQLLAGSIAIALALPTGLTAGCAKTGHPSRSVPGLAAETPASRMFSDRFSRAGTLVETGRPDESASADWWLNSGAYLFFRNGHAETVQGRLAANDPWRLKYSRANPGETDDGFHPQNIFRLISRATWRSYTQDAYFRINRYILSPDTHRQASNGLLLMNRYVDGQNLYYAGLRVDGLAVIKKKYRGQYSTMATAKVLPGVWDRRTTPNLIPTDTWIGVRSKVSDTPDGRVRIEVSLDRTGSGSWSKVLEAYDDGSRFGGPSIDTTASVGIRTDFMDVQLKDYAIHGR